MVNAKTNGILSLVLVWFLASCGQRQMAHQRSIDTIMTDQQIVAVSSGKVFFGHQSVGNDLIQGIKDLGTLDHRIELNIVKSPNPQSIPAPALVEFEIGENGNPQSKIDAFISIIDRGMGGQGGIAMFKFCYADIDASTDVPRMFNSYCTAISRLEATYPSLRIIHVTVPLASAEPKFKAWVKRFFGKAEREEANRKRNQFNTFLRRNYGGQEPIFDLAEVESTHQDGSREYFVDGDEKVFTLAPEYTNDGGHLNDLGRRLAAERFLRDLSRL